MKIYQRYWCVWNIPESHKWTAGDGSDAGNDIIEPGGGVVGEHATVRDPGEVDAVHVDAVSRGDVVDDSSGEGDVIVARGVVAGVLGIAGGAGVHAVDGAPVLARQGAGGAEGTVSTGTVPAFPSSPLMRFMFIRSITMNHNETLWIFICHIIETSPVLLGGPVPSETMEVNHKWSGPIVKMRIVSRKMKPVVSIYQSLVGVIYLNLELMMMSWIG